MKVHDLDRNDCILFFGMEDFVVKGSEVCGGRIDVD